MHICDEIMVTHILLCLLTIFLHICIYLFVAADVYLPLQGCQKSISMVELTETSVPESMTSSLQIPNKSSSMLHLKSNKSRFPLHLDNSSVLLDPSPLDGFSIYTGPSLLSLRSSVDDKVLDLKIS